MRQSSFAEAGFERYSKRTRRERFLQEMDRVVPWEELEALIEPCYPSKQRGAGRPAVGLDRMLWIHFPQHWFNLSDPAVEEARSRDASDQEGQPVVLRDESSHWRGPEDQADPLGGDHPGQCA